MASRCAAMVACAEASTRFIASTVSPISLTLPYWRVATSCSSCASCCSTSPALALTMALPTPGPDAGVVVEVVEVAADVLVVAEAVLLRA